MKFKCRQLDREGTEREVESDDYVFVPDIYCAEFVRFTEPGNVTFVEVFVGAEIVLWEVKALCVSPLCFITKRTTHNKAREEIRQATAVVN